MYIVVKNSMKHLSCCILAFLIAVGFVEAFELPLVVDIRNESDIYQLQEDGLISEDIEELLLELSENPLDINKADVDELYSLPGLTRTDAQNIVNQRKRVGGFKRWNDLLKLPNFDKGKLKQIGLFAYVRPPRNLSDGQLRLDFSDVAEDDKDYYSRVRLRADVRERIFIGLSGKREDDETYRWQENIAIEPAGWQFDKLCVAWNSKRFQVILGNYSAGFGSGLVFNDASMKHPNGIYADYTTSPYRQRGISVAFKYKLLRQTIFLSQSSYPTVVSSECVEELERQRTVKDAYSEKLLGTDVSLQISANSSIGWTWYLSKIDDKLPGCEFRNLPNRESWGAYGLHFKTDVSGLFIRGEVAQTVDVGKRAFYLELSKEFQSVLFLASLRKYDVNFDNPHSHGFANSDDSTDKNVDGDIDEVGAYLQLRYKPHPKFTLTGYYNQWQHPSTNITDNEAYAQSEYKLSNLRLGISAKWKDVDLSVSGEERFGALLFAQFSLRPALLVTTAYRFFKIQRTKIYEDDYAYIKLEWRIRKWLELEARTKTNDTKLVDGDTFPKESYLQIQLFKKRGLNGRLKYMRTHYGVTSKTSPNPKNIFSARLEYKW